MNFRSRSLLLGSLAAAVTLSAATLYQGATLLPLGSGQDTPTRSRYLLVSDTGVITALGAGAGSGDTAVATARTAPGFSVVNLAGKIVMPGFVSGHSHLWQSAFCGITPGSEFPAWLQGLH